MTTKAILNWLIGIFAVIFAIGLIGSVYSYVQPSASNWNVAFVFMLIVGIIGFLVSLIRRFIRSFI